MCFVQISEQTATFALQNIKKLVFITEVESVYSAVRTKSWYKTDTLHLQRVKCWKLYNWNHITLIFYKHYEMMILIVEYN
jgi:hypothetical protein